MLDKQQVVKNLKQNPLISSREHRIYYSKPHESSKPFWPWSQVKGARRCSSIPTDVARSKKRGGGLFKAAQKGLVSVMESGCRFSWLIGFVAISFSLLFFSFLKKILRENIEGCCDVKMKEEFEQTVYLGGKLCNKVSKEIICSCFCEVNLAEGISGTPPLSENLAIHTHIYIYVYIYIMYI